MTNTTEEAAKFLVAAHNGPLKWRAMCLNLQRSARGLPAVYPSALSAAQATPESDRVYHLDALRRGMVAFCDDPNDSNPYGHIFFITGRNKAGDILTWSNDVKRTGGVDLVPITFYREHWGDSFQFGATSLNGYDFHDFDPPKPKPGRKNLNHNIKHAIEDLEKAYDYHNIHHHTATADALKRDIAHLKKRYKIN